MVLPRENMKSCLILFALLFLLCACNTVDTVLIAQISSTDGSTPLNRLTLFNDSTFEFRHKAMNETSQGKFSLRKDTIYLSQHIKLINSDKAILRGNFLEFIDGTYPLKIRLTQTKLKSTVTFDTAKYSDYAFFSFSRQAKRAFYAGVPTDLTTSDLDIVDSLLNRCFNENSSSISRKPAAYVKQCIAVIDSNGDKVVWVNLSSKGHGEPTDYQYYIISVKDGGDCYLNLKINITRFKCYDLLINGDA